MPFLSTGASLLLTALHQVINALVQNMAIEGLVLTPLCFGPSVMSGAIEVSSGLSKAETGSLCEPPQVLSSYLGKGRHGNDLGIADMKK